MKPIFLVGFMGAGKSTLGKQLAKKLSCEFIDTDQLVCQLSGMQSINDVVANQGMNSFRKIEKEALRQTALDNTVIATGGGAPMFYDNMSWMKFHGTVVYIQLDEKTLLQRLKKSNLEERPLLSGKTDEELQQYIVETLRERVPVYQLAHFTFNPIKEKLQLLADKLLQINTSHI